VKAACCNLRSCEETSLSYCAMCPLIVGSVCGLLVCVFCAPTGGEIRGDGYSAKIELPDYRTVVPSLNHVEPQTTCRCCFINSYNL
jgi:hypothetical protein